MTDIIAVDAIANAAAREAVGGSNAALKAIEGLLTKAKMPMEAVRHAIFGPGKQAALNAIRALGPNATKEAAAAAARNAVSQVAQAEIAVARRAAEQAILKEAEKLAAEAAARKVSEAATKKAAEATLKKGTELAVRQTTQRGLTQAAARGVPLLEAGAPGAVEVAGAGVGVTVAAVAAAVVAVGLAAWQGYELYEDLQRGGFVSKEELAEQNAARFNVKNVEKDTQEAEKIMDNKLRGAAMVARTCASDLMVEMKQYGEMAGDKQRLQNLVEYSQKAKENLISGMGTADKDSQNYKEAEAALKALEMALAAAPIIMTTGVKLDDSSESYKTLYEAKERAILEKNKTNQMSNIDKTIKSLGTLGNKDKDALIVELKSLKELIPGFNTPADYRNVVIPKLNALQGRATDMLLKEENKITPENAQSIIQRYIGKYVPKEAQKNQEFMARLYGFAAGLIGPDTTVKQFDEAMKAGFAGTSDWPENIWPNNMVPISEYFEQTDHKGWPAIKGPKWDVWDPVAAGYLVGLAHKAKTHKDLGSSSGAYIDDIQKLLKDPKWQDSFPEEARNGGKPFMDYLMKSLAERNLASPEAYFGYKPEEEPKEEEKKKPKPVAKGGPGTGQRRPAAGPSKPGEKVTEEQKQEALALLKSALAKALGAYAGGNGPTFEDMQREGLNSADQLAGKVQAQINANLGGGDFKALAGETVTPMRDIAVVIDKQGKAALQNPAPLLRWAQNVWEGKQKESGGKAPEALAKAALASGSAKISSIIRKDTNVEAMAVEINSKLTAEEKKALTKDNTASFSLTRSIGDGIYQVVATLGPDGVARVTTRTSTADELAAYNQKIRDKHAKEDADTEEKDQQRITQETERRKQERQAKKKTAKKEEKA